MSSILVANVQGEPQALPRPLVGFLAAGAGLGAATLYYSQPMLGVLGPDIGASPQAVGLVPTLTQLGYALGILLLAPLGDRLDRRRIILTKAVLLSLALLGAAWAPSLGWLLVASLAVGLAATLAQDIVPAAASLAPEAHRGRVVGTVMTGLMLGVLLSRLVSGWVADVLGWRAMFVLAALSLLGVGLAAWHMLPRFAPTTRLPYGGLLASLWQLWRRHEPLRRAAWAQGLLAVGFSAFWSTLAVMLHGAPFHLGSAVAGAFGLAGAAGALAAPLVGRLADRGGPQRVTLWGTALAAVAFGAMALGAGLPATAQLVVIALAAVAFDLGFQATLVAHQTLIYGMDPGARSRLNAVLFTSMFSGMAVGAGLGTLLLAQAGWLAVALMATATSLGAWWLRWKAAR